MLAKEHINVDDDLLIANSDQIIEYEKDNFTILKSNTDFDGIVYCFNDVHPKWSFAKLNSRHMITEIREKEPISNIATCGIYWFRHGSDFVSNAESMIENDLRVNGEFYVAPTYNQMIGDGKKVSPFYVTPEDLNNYLRVSR